MTNQLNELSTDGMRLYHGTSVSGISQFEVAEECTVGSGVYLTTDPEAARGYAQRRARYRGGEPHIYEARAENARLVDLRDPDSLAVVMGGFGKVLKNKLADPTLPWHAEGRILDSLGAIPTVTPANIREVTFGFPDTFTQHVASQGFDGLYCAEGGEGSEVGAHDSVLIFDPSLLGITSIQKLTATVL